MYDPKNPEKTTLIHTSHLHNSPISTGLLCFARISRTNVLLPLLMFEQAAVKQPFLISGKLILTNSNAQWFNGSMVHQWFISLYMTWHVEWFSVSLHPSVNDAWNMFCDQFSANANRHATVKKMGIINGLCLLSLLWPWLLIHQIKAALHNAWLSNSPADCLAFR